MDTPFRIGDKDAYLSLQGVWLVEFSELESMSKAESTAIKAFVTSPEDRFRPPYGSRMVKMPRRAVLAGTTNSDQFLKDSTGERRFWPVHVTEVRLDLIRAARDQLFAEALHRLEHERGSDEARYYPTRAEEEELFHPEQDKWRMVDVWTDILSDYVSKDFTPNDAVRGGRAREARILQHAGAVLPCARHQGRSHGQRPPDANAHRQRHARSRLHGNPGAEGRQKARVHTPWLGVPQGGPQRIPPNGSPAPQANTGASAPPDVEEAADADLPI
jgi:predicted P-loop ATPase